MNSRKFANICAYIAIVLVAIALVVKYVATNFFGMSSEIAGWFDRIAYYLTALVTLFSAFSYAKSRRNSLYMAGLVIAVVVIVVFMFVL